MDLYLNNNALHSTIKVLKIKGSTINCLHLEMHQFHGLSRDYNPIQPPKEPRVQNYPTYGPQSCLEKWLLPVQFDL